MQQNRIISNRTIVLDRGLHMDSRETIAVPIHILENRSGTPGATLLLIRLFCRGGYMLATVRKMAQELGIDKSTLSRAIDQLEEAGLIEHRLLENENGPGLITEVKIVGMEAEA